MSDTTILEYRMVKKTKPILVGITTYPYVAVAGEDIYWSYEVDFSPITKMIIEANQKMKKAP